MTTPQKSANDILFGSSVGSWKFETPGTRRKGTIVDIGTQIAYEYNPNPQAPKVAKKYPSGDDIEEIVLTLQTDERDGSDDDGKRKWYISSVDAKQKLRSAISAAGGRSLELGADVEVLFTHTEGANNKKIYEVTYTTRANVALSVGKPVSPPAAATPAPAPAASAVPPLPSDELIAGMVAASMPLTPEVTVRAQELGLIAS